MDKAISRGLQMYLKTKQLVRLVVLHIVINMTLVPVVELLLINLAHSYYLFLFIVYLKMLTVAPTWFSLVFSR
jgi:hypothetical protein